MNRRRFILTAGSIAASAAVAGCAGGPGSSGGAGGSAAASTTVVQNVPEEAGSDASPGTDGGSPAVTETGAEELLLESIIYQPAGQKGLVVAGELRNRSDRAFEETHVEVTLYDGNEATDEILDRVQEQVSRDEPLEAGNTWQWAATFRDKPSFPVDYFSVTGRGDYD